MQNKYPHLEDVPSLYTAMKADQDKTTQRSEIQPDEYTKSIDMPPPLHVSTTWPTISELYAHIAEAAMVPSSAFPKSDEPPVDRTNLFLSIGAVAAVSIAVVMIWRRASANSS
jgi:mitochondrial Rho GTPase 1